MGRPTVMILAIFALQHTLVMRAGNAAARLACGPTPIEILQQDAESVRERLAASDLQGSARTRPGPPVRHRPLVSSAHLNPPQRARLKLTAEPTTAYIGDDVKFKLESTGPVAVVEVSDLTFNFDDGSPTTTPTKEAVPFEKVTHRFDSARRYTVRAKAQLHTVGAAPGSPIVQTVQVLVVVRHAPPPPPPPAGAAILIVDRSTVKVGDDVLLSVKFDSQRPSIQYLFVFGDGRETQWQGPNTTTHSYASPGSYSAYAKVRVRTHGTYKKDATTAKVEINVERKPPSSPSTNGAGGGFVAALTYLIGGLTGLLILVSGILLLRRGARGRLRPGELTFRAQPDAGMAQFAENKPPDIEFQIVLDPGLSQAQSRTITSEGSLIRSNWRHDG